MRNLALSLCLVITGMTAQPAKAYVEFWGDWICISTVCIDIGFSAIWDEEWRSNGPPNFEPTDYVPPLIGIPAGIEEFVDLIGHDDLEFYPRREVNLYLFSNAYTHLRPDSRDSDFDFKIVGNMPGGHLYLYRGANTSGTLMGSCTGTCDPVQKKFTITYDYSAWGDAEKFTMYNCRSTETLPNCADKQTTTIRVFDHWYNKGLIENTFLGVDTVAHMHDYNASGFSDGCDHFQSDDYGASMSVCPALGQGPDLWFISEAGLGNTPGGYNIYWDSEGTQRVKFIEPAWLVADDPGINYLSHGEVTAVRDYGERVTNHYCKLQFSWPSHSKFEGGTIKENAVREIYRAFGEAALMIAQYGLAHFDEYRSDYIDYYLSHHQWYGTIDHMLDELRAYYVAASPKPTAGQLMGWALSKWDRVGQGGDNSWKPVFDGEIIEPTIYCWTQDNNK